jgi:hypothetical protein
MKKSLFILSWITIFAACKKDTPSHGLGSGYYPTTKVEHTLNFKYVKDCSMKPLGGETITWNSPDGAVSFQTDSDGNVTRKYQMYAVSAFTSGFSTSFKIDSMTTGFSDGRWNTNESLLIVKNDTTRVNIQFIYNANSAAQLKDSLAIGNIWLPELTKDTTISVMFVGRYKVFRKDFNGNFVAVINSNILLTPQKKWLITPPQLNTNLLNSPCSTQGIVIQ